MDQYLNESDSEMLHLEAKNWGFGNGIYYKSSIALK